MARLAYSSALPSRLGKGTDASRLSFTFGFILLSSGVPNTPGGNGLDAWASDHATSHEGRISRDAYMTEAGRRFDTLDASKRNGITRQQYLDDLTRQWDTLDRDHRGLTPAEVSRFTGKVDVDSAGLPRSGSGAQAGNMGPSNSKAQ